MKKANIFKFVLTGIIYALTTCIIQVPFADLVYKLLKLEPDSSMDNVNLPGLLLAILVVGVAMAVFYYYYGHLFGAKSRLLRGIKFTLFIYFSNYVPQVFFLDATEGAEKLLHGGFPVIQVEFFDFIILLITVLAMICFIDCSQVDESNTSVGRDIDDFPENENQEKNSSKWIKAIDCRNILVGGVYAGILMILNELIMPILGFTNMADGLAVSSDNRMFFYAVMAVGFVIAGIMVAYMASKACETECRHFIFMYALLVWCAFDLTMIPLGFGLSATILFIVACSIAFAGEYLVLRLTGRVA